MSVYFIAGMTGCGKTTIGRYLASVTKRYYLDADSLHHPSHIKKMKRGKSISPSERTRFIRRVGRHINNLLGADEETRHGIVCSCSLLNYYDRLRIKSLVPDAKILLVELPERIRLERVGRRKNHFAGNRIARKQISFFSKWGSFEGKLKNVHPINNFFQPAVFKASSQRIIDDLFEVKTGVSLVR